MSEMFEMAYIPDYQGDKNVAFYSSTHTPVGTDNIQLAVQQDVDLNRQTEIIEGWRQLWNFMRDTNILSGTGTVYLARHIDANTDQARILPDLTGVLPDDIVIGLGANVNAGGGLGEEMAVNMLETAFRQLREVALEQFFKGIPVATVYEVPVASTAIAAGTYSTPAVATLTGTVVDAIVPKGTVITMTITRVDQFGSFQFSEAHTTKEDLSLFGAAISLSSAIDRRNGTGVRTFAFRNPSNPLEVQISVQVNRANGGVSATLDLFTIT